LLTSAYEGHSHVPLNIGFQDTQDERTFECLVQGKFEAGVFVRLLVMLESGGVKVLRSSFEARLQESCYAATLLLQIKKSDVDMFNLVAKIMLSRLVTAIEFSPRNNRPFSTYRFPINLVADKRAILFTVDAIASLEDNFRKKFGSEADSTFHNLGKSYGVDLVNHCPKRSGSESETDFVDAVLEITKATGWGLSKWEIRDDG
jgi:hypothetical protein